MVIFNEFVNFSKISFRTTHRDGMWGAKKNLEDFMMCVLEREGGEKV
jgi:hypothetical protein